MANEYIGYEFRKAMVLATGIAERTLRKLLAPGYFAFPF